MEDHALSNPNYHILLIGIDEYPFHALRGCVNDIDAIQRLLVRQMGIPASRIHRLASPRLHTRHDTDVPEQPATLQNMRDALIRLGSEAVAADDRVFIYYAGHGKRVAVVGPGGHLFHREALVPADFAGDRRPDQFLFDFEFNERLRAILARTPAVTVVLDCCHAASASRGSSERTFFEGAPVPMPSGMQIERSFGAGTVRGMAAGLDVCQVVSACLAHELAHEDQSDGRPGGALTRAFVAALGSAGAGDLRSITWGQIWEPMYERLTSRAVPQHPEIAGSRARLVFGGPPVEGDAGIPVSYDPARGRYRIAAGSLADVTEGTVLAVYDRQPAVLPPRESAEDHAARIGLVRVETAQPATALATAITPEGAVAPGRPLPVGSRARITAAGQAARLRYGVTPGHPEIQFESRLLERAPDGEPAPVRLELSGDRWLLVDDEHTLEDGAAVLCALRPTQVGRAREVLEHYYSYALPLRIAQRASPDRNGDLQLRVLRCPAWNLRSEDAQQGELPEAEPGGGRYALVTGARVCFRICNLGSRVLRVTLLNAAASGRVQWLGDQILSAGAQHTFWAESSLGVPFAMSPPDGQRRGIDRVVAIGRTQVAIELDHLVSDVRFADLVEPRRDAGGSGRRDLGTPPGAQLDRWAAAVAVIDTRDASEWPRSGPGAPRS